MTVRQSLMAPLADNVIGAVEHVCALYKVLFGCRVSRVLITGYTTHLSKQLMASSMESGVLTARVPTLLKQQIETVWLLAEPDWHYSKAMGLLRHIDVPSGPLVNVYELRDINLAPRLGPDHLANEPPAPPMLE